MNAPTGYYAAVHKGEMRSVARWYWPSSTITEVWADGAWVDRPLFLTLNEDPDWVSITEDEANAWIAANP